MKHTKKEQFDQIGYWSEIKLDIIKDYAKEYSKILSSKKQARFYHVYIDAFAGAGINISKTTGEFVLGSPLNALLVEPPFREFHFIDLAGDKVTNLKQMVEAQPNVHIYHGDCNDVLLKEVFPNVSFKDYRRGLCLLDPYGLHLKWEVIQRAGSMRSIDMFLNFPIMDMNRNALWRNPKDVDKNDIARMNAFWGDDSWCKVAYQTQPTLFGPVDEKTGNKAIVEAFRTRLKTIGGFKQVPKPLPMRNSKGAVVYYLFFASQKAVAQDIVDYIFKKYHNRGVF